MLTVATWFQTMSSANQRQKCPIVAASNDLPQYGGDTKIARQTKWTPRSSEEAIVATAESLLQFGLLKKSA
jgi:hypothetical protein